MADLQADATISIPAVASNEVEVDVAIDFENVPKGTPVLAVVRGAQAGTYYVLDEGTTTAGRHPESDIFLDDITVSRRHVEFERNGTQVELRDVGSLNGTYVNKDLADKCQLANGDEVQIGKYKLLFAIDSE